MRVTIPVDLSTRSFIPLPRFFNSLAEHLLFLTHLWSYFRSNLPERRMMCVHFASHIVLLS